MQTEFDSKISELQDTTEKVINMNHDTNEKIMRENHEEMSTRLLDYNIEF